MFVRVMEGEKLRNDVMRKERNRNIVREGGRGKNDLPIVIHTRDRSNNDNIGVLHAHFSISIQASTVNDCHSKHTQTGG